MTVPSTTRIATYNCDNALTAFAFTYPFFASGDLVVTLITVADGTELVLVEGAGAGKYEVSTTENSYRDGGTVTVGTTYSNLYQIQIERVVDITQDTEYDKYDAFPALTTEDALDRLTMIDQQIQAQVDAQQAAIDLNTAKATNVPTELSAGTVTAITYGITSDGGADDIVLPEADTSDAGLLGASKWDEIVANTAYSGVGHIPLSDIETVLSASETKVTSGKAVTDAITTITGGSVVSASLPATDNAVARYDGTTGLLVEESLVTISDIGSIAAAGSIVAVGALQAPNALIEGSSPYVRLDNSTASDADGAREGGIRFYGTSVADDSYNHGNIVGQHDGSGADGKGRLVFATSITDGTLTTAMTIDSSGNVGIGYTTPSNFSGGTTRLVAGGGSGNEGITIFSGNTGTGSIAFADGTTMTQRYEGLVTYNHNTNYMGLWTNHVERMKIDSSGAVNIVGALTAASYADNTPFFSGDAITEIMKVKGKDGELDHKTLPTFARITKTEKVKDKDGKIEKDVDGKDKVKITEHRDLGAMISILTKGMQEQQTLITAQAQTINNQDDRIKALESV